MRERMVSAIAARSAAPSDVLDERAAGDAWQATSEASESANASIALRAAEVADSSLGMTEK